MGFGRPAPLLAAVLVAACASDGTFVPKSAPIAREAAPAAPIHLTLVATNDLHGWVYPRQLKLAGGATATEGGLATFAGYVSILRKQNPGGVLLLDGGDLFQGTLPSNLTEGAVVIDGMNSLGYTASALGNHEFDYGPEGPAPVAIRADQDPLGALKARIRQARFPILAANVREASTGDRPSWLGNDGTMLVAVKGVKVGILGLSTPSTPSVTNPVNVTTLRFNGLAPEAEAVARSLRERGAEVVIGLAHAGGKCSDWSNPNDLSSCDREDGEVFEMMEKLPPGTLDALIAGHTHAPMGHFLNGTPVVETPGMGRFFSLIDLYLDPIAHKVLRESTRITALVPICAEVDQTLLTCESRKLAGRKDVKLVQASFLGEPVVPDEALASALAPARAMAQDVQQRSLGITVPAPLTRKYEAESALGLVLADALREHEKADIALLNPGGLRADLRAGELRYGDVYEVIPFDNAVATLTLNGEELQRLFQAVYGSRKGVFQVSGARVRLSMCPGPARLKGFTLESGKPPRPDARYRVVMPDFLARGGDGLGPMMASLPPGAIDLGSGREDNFRDAVIDQWVTGKATLVAPEGGRVTFVDDGADCSAGAKLDPQSSH